MWPQLTIMLFVVVGHGAEVSDDDGLVLVDESHSRRPVQPTGCSCKAGGTCRCCASIIVPEAANVGAYQPCFDFAFVKSSKDLALHSSCTLEGEVMFDWEIYGEEAAPACFNPERPRRPMTLLCLNMYNITLTTSPHQACLQLEGGLTNRPTSVRVFVGCIEAYNM